MLKTIPSITDLLTTANINVATEPMLIPSYPMPQFNLFSNHLEMNQNQYNIQPPNVQIQLPSITNKEDQQTIRQKKIVAQEEESKLKFLVSLYGVKNWVDISKAMGTLTPRQCKERYETDIKPQVKLANWTLDEDIVLIQQYSKCGPKWSMISKLIPGRSPNGVKNRWKVLLKKSQQHEIEMDHIKTGLL